MKKCSTLKLLLATISLFLSVSLQAQEMSPVTVHVETAGTLSTLIPAKDKYLITDFTLSGNLNGTDILYIREMAGGGLWKDSKTDGKLKKLDLSNANIVSGGDAYYQFYYCFYVEYAEEFIGNNKLMSLKTSDNEISEYMFFNLKNLSSIILPRNITSIEGYALAECSGLTSLIIPDKVLKIGVHACYNCSALKSVAISNSIVNIYESAFGNCTGLSSIAIPSSLESFYPNAFEGCTGLKEFVVSEDNAKFSTVEGVLFNKDKKKILAYPNAKSSKYIIPNTVTIIGDCAFYGCSSLTSVEIPNTVEGIGFKAFALCDSLTSITVPSSVSYMGEHNPFYGCSALKEFIVSDNNPNFKTIDGVLFSKDGTRILAYPNAKSSEYIIPNGVKEIYYETFACCDTLVSVTIPNSVELIYSGAFYECPLLTTVNMGSSISQIGDMAFYNCKRLESINIPNSVLIIGGACFVNCESLTSVTLGKRVFLLDLYTFVGCSALKEIYCKNSTPSSFAIDNGLVVYENVFGQVDRSLCKLYVPKGSYILYRIADVWGEFDFIVDEESTAISKVETNNVSVYTESGNVVIKNAELGKIVEVYNTLGALLQTVKVTDNELRINLPINQIYLIRIEDKRYKVAL